MNSRSKYRAYWDCRETAPTKLNSRGRPYRRTPNFKSPEKRLQAQRARELWKWHNRSQRLIRLGLTTRGTVRKYHLYVPTPKVNKADVLRREARERMARLWELRRPKSAWQEFRAGISVGVVCFEDIGYSRQEVERA